MSLGQTMGRSVFGVYANRTQVERAVDALRESGFSNNDVSVLLPENEKSSDKLTEHPTKAPEGAATGAGSGALVGGALGWLVGMGALVIPGLGPFLAAGPLVATLVGAGAGGAFGGVTGALVGMGIPEAEAKIYHERMLTGGTLIVVHCDSTEREQKARAILLDTGAEDLSRTGGAGSEERTRVA